jgi:hypothetical protein
VEQDYDIERLNDRLVKRYWGKVNWSDRGSSGSAGQAEVVTF